MKKILSTILFSSGLLFSAESLKVLNGDVTVQINGLSKKLQENQTLELAECDTVSYINGQGKIKIKNLIFTKDTPIKTFKATCTNNYFSSIAGKLFASSEATKYGVSLRGDGSKNQTVEYNVEIPKNDTKIVEKDFIVTKELLFIDSKRFYPLPVVLEIFDAKNQLIYSLENRTDPKSIFKIDMEMIHSGCHVMVTSIRTDEILINIFFE